MKEVKLKQMSLTNFKGLRDVSITFNDDVTSILGKNGSGKTTIFDAFTWLLFGKDSEDRKAFNIKTLDSNGNAIERLPHEVSAVLTVGTDEITLRRRFVEKWVKKRGSATEEFTGHEEERLYNEVPMSLKDWNAKIADICPEQTFKFITNPLYFSQQKADVQRSMLFRMAGDVSDADIASGNAEFETLLSQLTGKTMDEYKREIANKKRRIKAEIEAIPERIDERKRDMPEAENWLELTTAISDKEYQLSQIDAQIADKNAAYESASQARLNKQREIEALRSQRLALEAQIRERVSADYYKQNAEQLKLTNEIDKQKAELQRITEMQKENEQRLAQLTENRQKLIAEWRAIKAETLTFDDNAFICPTCKRPLDIEDIEAKQREMTENFNQTKAQRLAKNTEQGKLNTEKMKQTEQYINACAQSIANLEAKLQTLQASASESKELSVPDASPAIEADEQHKSLSAQIEALTGEISQSVAMPDVDELKAKKKSLSDELSQLKIRLSRKETIERNDARIKELETLLRSQNEELARLEGIEFTIAAFSKARVQAIEQRINGLFKLVKFKMFEQQINGGEVETCIATIDGVPYSDLNNAGKINGGLDIINAICEFEQITAPVFCDNAEAVNTLLSTRSQMIRLVVSDDETLTVQ